MPIALTALIVVHGLIHLLGFLKWSGLAAVPQLSDRTLFPISPAAGRIFGALWLGAFLILLIAAALRVTRHDAWWMAAIVGILLSQALVIVAWRDAKFGTIANLLILVPALAAAAHTRFEHKIDEEVEALLAQTSSSHASIVQREDLDRLPAPVNTWLEASGIIGRDRAHVVRLKQRGELRTSPEGAWMPAEAEQYFTVDEPGFVWRVDTSMMGIVPIAGRDRYFAGKGHMLIKAASTLSFVDAADEKIDLGTMLRFLGEIVWFPSAALSPYIEWEPIDTTNAKATMRHAGVTASAVFTFDERGRVVAIRAERYLGGGADAKLTPWSVSCSEWRVVRGIQIPTRGDVIWRLPGGDFDYYRWEILDVETNVAERYGR